MGFNAENPLYRKGFLLRKMSIFMIVWGILAKKSAYRIANWG
jgi:hypothetical protein